jgi:putative hydrolase of HD superfamily
MDFFSLLTKLKETKRQGWINNKIPNPESISDHMYRMAIMSLVLPETVIIDGQQSYHINVQRCAIMCLIHDMAESIVGDITPDDKHISLEEKCCREEVRIEGQ